MKRKKKQCIEYMNNKRYTVLDVKGNGHCLFRSIGQVLYYNLHGDILNDVDEMRFAINLRRFAISYVCSKNGNTRLQVDSNITFKKSLSEELKTTHSKVFKKYCKCQYTITSKDCKPQRLFTWGGFHEINALCVLLNTPIIVHKENKEKIVFCKSFKSKPLEILYVNNSHYKALLPMNVK